MSVRISALIDSASSPRGHRLAWVAAGDDGRPLGTAFLRLPGIGDVGELEQLQVHPAECRAGVGTRLLAAAVEAASEHGKKGLLAPAVAAGSAGDAFCSARGMRQALALTYTRLPLADTALEATPVVGYRLVQWDGTVPDELAETFARARPAMDDMPMGESGYPPQTWDVERVHAVAAAVEKRGELLCTTAAIAADGDMAGFTEVVLAGDGTGDGQHYGTGVLAAHRGRGLARWMKIEQIALLKDRFPQLQGLLTDCADDNTAMRRVNDTLGYRPTHRSLLYRLDL